ncbi:MAG: hypothetical protein ABGX26_04330 [Nautiliaceae bacterium]
MLNIVTALSIEAKPIIKHFNLKAKNEIYQNNYLNLTITGSGKLKSAINTTILLTKYQFPTLNIGIAGSNEHQINQGFFIHKIIDTDSNLKYYPDFFQDNSETLHTVSQIKTYYPLVDMEGSGFFEACYKFLSVEEIILYKIVSDTPLREPKKDLIPSLIKNHIHVIENLLDSLPKKEEFFKEINEALKEASLKMHLTKTQYNQLKNILTYYKLINKPFPKFYKIRKKEDVKKFITSLTS